MTAYPFDVLVARAAALADLGPRRLLGIVGAPGAGKSTLAARLVEAVGPTAALVPMDGYHLAQAELDRLGRHERKGAIDTFDGPGYVSMLGRLAAGGPETIYAPAFHREIEEPVAGSIAVPPEVRLVVTEGNYLLVPEEPWSGVRLVLDEVWYLDLDEELRLRRLVARHMAYGRSQAEAKARSYGSDQVNAELIATTRNRADLIVRVIQD
ncbi:phosphoribulokinase/uridine kinase family protein [Asanoa ferruginea]|uniref:Phosphoribulokinase/uridine kinase family protein n=1 Tax=Asanoa ferruginea TaxID=53367 RepID=A0A3D9ZMF4_9ACTN|nr:nucleoside/nucleotide kinase family protein [Asanoa ferruginea]REF97113.1 phosphoribulokinase/uridine kinase family protein [Asanoa ferruginea]GIF53612.1 nucleoside/nucleotide kinase family protein [Asanoa ferruginea]